MSIERLEIQISDNSEQAVGGLDRLSASLSHLRSATTNSAGLNKVSKALQGINQAAQSSGFSNLTKQVGIIVSALKPLEDLGKNNLTSFVTQLNKIPDVTEKLDLATTTAFAQSIERVTEAVKPLAVEMEKIAMGFSALPVKMQRFITQVDKSTKSTGTATNTYRKMTSALDSINTKLNFAAIYTVGKRVFNLLGKMVQSAADYVEDINLYTVALGEYAQAASEYANRAQNLLGIDANQFLREMGVFSSIAEGLGVASDSANVLSQNLTQLAYDLSSFRNISFETAFEKLQSGITGQTKPLMELGISVHQATLEQTALKYGIDQSVSSMTEAQKVMLRYVTIMDASTQAMGDMGRTLETPGNQIRIFQQQIQLLSRSLGSLFIPILNKVIPYVLAFVKVLRMAADAVAQFFGFTLPTIDYSNLDSISAGIGGAADEADDLSSGLSDAASQAKKLRDYVMGFDELNIINPPDDTSSSGGSGGSAGGGIGGDLGIDLPSYDFLDGLNAMADELIPKMKDLLKYVLAFAAALAAIKLLKFLSSMANLLKNLSPLGKAFASVAAAALSFFGGFLVGEELFRLFNGELEGFSLKMGIGIVAMVAGTAALAAMLGPAGLVIGVLASLTGVLVGYSSAQAEAQKQTSTMTVFATNGGIPIMVLRDNFIELTDKVNASSASIMEYGSTLAGNQESMDLAATKLANLATAIADTGAEAEASLAPLQEQFSELFNLIIERGETARQTLIAALITAPAMAADQTGANIPHLMSIINTAFTGLSEDALTYQQDFETAMSRLEGLSTDDSAYIGAYEEAQAAALGLLGLTDTGQAALDGLSNTLSKYSDMDAVDFSSLIVEGDADATLANLNSLLGEIDTAGATAMVSLSEAQLAIQESLDYLSAYMTPEEIEMLQGFFAKAFEIQSDQILSEQQTAIDAINEGFTTAVENVVSEAEPTFWESFFNGDIHGRDVEAAQKRVRGQFESVFEALDASQQGIDTGTNLAAGVTEGLTTGSADTISQAIESAKSILNAISTTFDEHSPSKETETMGLYLMQGLSNGIEDNGKSVNVVARTSAESILTTMSDAFESDTVIVAFSGMLNQLLSYFEMFSQNLANGVNSTISNMAGAFNSTSWNGSSVSAGTASGATIPRLAVGMSFVPMDDYLAFLHYGEAVLTAPEASLWRSLGGASGIIATLNSRPTAEQVLNSPGLSSSGFDVDAHGGGEAIDYQKLAEAVSAALQRNAELFEQGDVHVDLDGRTLFESNVETSRAYGYSGFVDTATKLG